MYICCVIMICYELNVEDILRTNIVSHLPVLRNNEELFCVYIAFIIAP